jgi:hypothetical protein
MGLPGLGFGLGFLSLGIVILTNGSHAEITVGEGLICAIERIGFLPIRRKRLIANLRRIVVRNGGITVKSKKGGVQTYAPELSSLEFEPITGKSMLMAMAYPHDMLRPLADVLAASLSPERQLGMVSEVESVVEVVEREASEEATDTVVSKPEKTDITVQTYQQGLAISVPSQGLWKGSKGLFGFSVFWNGFMTVFTVLMVKGHPPASAYLFIVGFLGIGIVMMLFAINMAKRKVMIAVVNNTLACRVIGLFKTSEQKLPIDMISAVRVGPSGMEVNNRPVMEVQVIPKEGKKIGLISNRTREEQEWVAYTLRRALNVGQG